MSAGAISTGANPFATARNSLPPAIDLPSANIGATGQLADHCPRRQARGNNRPFLFLDQRRRRSGPVITSTRAIAPSLALVQALSFAPVLQDGPDSAPQRKAALGGRLRSIDSPAKLFTKLSGFLISCAMPAVSPQNSPSRVKRAAGAV